MTTDVCSASCGHVPPKRVPASPPAALARGRAALQLGRIRLATSLQPAQVVHAPSDQTCDAGLACELNWAAQAPRHCLTFRRARRPAECRPVNGTHTAPGAERGCVFSVAVQAPCSRVGGSKWGGRRGERALAARVQRYLPAERCARGGAAGGLGKSWLARCPAHPSRPVRRSRAALPRLGGSPTAPGRPALSARDHVHFCLRTPAKRAPATPERAPPACSLQQQPCRRAGSPAARTASLAWLPRSPPTNARPSYGETPRLGPWATQGGERSQCRAARRPPPVRRPAPRRRLPRAGRGAAAVSPGLPRAAPASDQCWGWDHPSAQLPAW